MINWDGIGESIQVPPKSVKLTDTEYSIDLDEAVLSRRDVEKELITGEECVARKNLEKRGYVVHPAWDDILDEQR